MSPHDEFRERVKSIPPEVLARLEEEAARPDYRPREVAWIPEGQDPFGMNWEWLYGVAPATSSTPTTQLPTPAPLAETPPKRALPRWAYVTAGTVLAASLLIGAVTLDRLFIRGRDGAKTEVLLASARANWADPRGEGKELQLRVESPIDGFVTLVGLAPDIRPRVRPAAGPFDAAVKAGTESDPIAVPPGSTRVVFVITPQPAGEVVRRLIEGQAAPRYTPEQEAEVRTALESLLKQKGYTKMAFGSLPVPAAP